MMVFHHHDHQYSSPLVAGVPSFPAQGAQWQLAVGLLMLLEKSRRVAAVGDTFQWGPFLWRTNGVNQTDAQSLLEKCMCKHM